MFLSCDAHEETHRCDAASNRIGTLRNLLLIVVEFANAILARGRDRKRRLDRKRFPASDGQMNPSKSTQMAGEIFSDALAARP